MHNSPLSPQTAARALAMFVLGGKGSGNFGHEGRPGEVGGSGPGGDVEVTEVETMRGIPALNFKDSNGSLLIETATRGGKRITTSNGNDWGWIASFKVDNPGKGHGFALFSKVFADFKKRGFAGIASQHDSRTDAAQRFWKSLIARGADVEDTGTEFRLKALDAGRPGQVGGSIDAAYVDDGGSSWSAINNDTIKEMLDFHVTRSPAVKTLLDELKRRARKGDTRAREVHDETVARLRARQYNEVRVLGGRGSGNYGHVGRPGLVGGSVPHDGSGEIENKNGKKLVVTFNPDYRTYTVSEPDAPRGVTVAAATMTRDGKRVMSVHVYPEHQRQGIATALYKHIERHIKTKLTPNWALTDDGQAFWKSRGLEFQATIVEFSVLHARALAEIGSTPLHTVADSHVAAVKVAVRYAFAMGRKSLVKLLPKAATTEKRNALAEKIGDEVERELLFVMPGTLTRAAVSGAMAGAELLSRRLRMLGGTGSGNFGHEGRPGQIGGSGDGNDSENVAPRWTTSGNQQIHKSGIKISGGEGVKSKSLEVLKTTLDTIPVPILQLADKVTIRIVSGDKIQGRPNNIRGSYNSDLNHIRLVEESPTNLEETVVHEVAHSIILRSDLSNETAFRADINSKTSKLLLSHYTKHPNEAAAKAFAIVSGHGKRDRAIFAKAFPATMAHVREWFEKNSSVRALGDPFRAAKKGDAKNIRFNKINKRAATWARKHSAEMVTDISETSRKAIKRAIANLIEGEDYRSILDKISLAVGDDDRAELIAHHETMTAVSEGQRQVWEQAVNDGLLTGHEKRVWITVPVGACPICEELDGTTADLDGKYPDGSPGPPRHVKCRCTEGLQ